MCASPATQNPLSHCQVSCFSFLQLWNPPLHLIFSYLLTIFSVLFSSTPGGYLKTKKVLHTFAAHLVDRAGFEPAAFRSSQAERLCEPNVLRPDVRQYTRLNYRPRNRRSLHTS